MKAFRPYLITLSLSLLLSSSLVLAKNNRLIEYEGRYKYIENAELNIVAGPENALLYAIIDGARYPLKPDTKDAFVTLSGSVVNFVRNSRDEIVGYTEKSSLLYARVGDNEERYERMFRAKPKHETLPYQYSQPIQTDGLMDVHKLSDDAPLKAAMEAMTTAIYEGEYPFTQSVLIYQNDTLVFEEYFYEYDQNTPHQMRSATKTLSAFLLGIAIDNGLITSLDNTLLSYFDDAYDIQNVDERKKAISLKHLASMQSGFACDDYDHTSPGNESTKNQSNDWVKFMLDLPMQHNPGTVGMYCSGNVTLINRIIELASGKSLVEFAEDVLFEPLGIKEYKWAFKPDRSSINNFNQAYMLPRDMMKIGVLLKNHGQWEDQTIVSANWIEALTQVQSEINGTPYGYLYWLRYYYRDSMERIEIPQISGNGGQKVIVLDAVDAVVVMTGGNYNAQSYTNELLDDFIIDGLRGEKAF